MRQDGLGPNAVPDLVGRRPFLLLEGRGACREHLHRRALGLTRGDGLRRGAFDGFVSGGN